MSPPARDEATGADERTPPGSKPRRSTELQLDRYDTDKVSHGYLERYDPVLEPWVDQPIKLLELGVHKGGSLELWRDYFPRGTIVGVDVRLPREFDTGERIHLYRGSQADLRFLSRVAAETAPDGFDVVIDDATHVGELAKRTFWHLFDRHLRPGGLYVIEDWGTGYWEDWPDGRALDLASYRRPPPMRHPLFWRVARKLRWKPAMPCHSHGMVGFVKQLVDEQGAQDVTRGRRHGEPGRASKFDHLLVTPSIVFIQKAAGGAGG